MILLRFLPIFFFLISPAAHGADNDSILSLCQSKWPKDYEKQALCVKKQQESKAFLAGLAKETDGAEGESGEKAKGETLAKMIPADLVDPTRPDGFKPKKSIREAKSAPTFSPHDGNWDVDLVRISSDPKRSWARINNQLVRAGDHVDDAVVKNITNKAIILDYKGKEVALQNQVASRPKIKKNRKIRVDGGRRQGIYSHSGQAPSPLIAWGDTLWVDVKINEALMERFLINPHVNFVSIPRSFFQSLVATGTAGEQDMLSPVVFDEKPLLPDLASTLPEESTLLEDEDGFGEALAGLDAEALKENRERAGNRDKKKTDNIHREIRERFRLRSMRVGGNSLHDLTVFISPDGEAPPFLGLAVLEALGDWTIDHVAAPGLTNMEARENDLEVIMEIER
ncbi:MAG: general secretion pathway protein GspB [Magnetococcales bacterium]|nr:general secretion pathway protein GspB [Magnetococcales bacterium]